MKRYSFAVLLLLMFACGDDDVGTPPDAAMDTNTAPDLETFLRDNNVVVLEMQDDGTELGTGMTPASGVALFYSPTHETFFEMSAEDGDVGSMLEGREVRVSVGESAMAYVIQDPLGMYAPVLHTEELTGEDRMVMVEGKEQLREEGMIVDFDPAAEEDPFPAFAQDVGSVQAPLFGTLAVLAVRTLMTSIVVGAVSSVLSNLVENACNVVAPLYTERCALAGRITGRLVGLAAGAYLGGGVTGWGLAGPVAETLLDVSGLTCGRLGALIGYVANPADRRAVDRYRRIAQKYNYLMHVMETDPKPDQPSWEEMDLHVAALIAQRDTVRNAYFQIWNGDSIADNKSTGFALDRAKDVVTELFNSQTATRQARILTELEITEVVRAYLRIGAYDASFQFEHFKYARATFETIEYTEEFSERGKAINGFFIGCGIDIVSSAILTQLEMGVRNEKTANVFDLVNGQLEVIEDIVDDRYREHWGGEIPMGDCLADLYEPNGTWMSASTEVVPVDLTSGVININELSLCDGTGMTSDEEDWYAFDIAPIAFEVGARITAPDPDMFPDARGQDLRVCADIFYYSQISELGGLPPEFLRGVCGRVDGWPATDPFGVRRSAGETWSQILVRVRPEDPTSGPIDYGLRFAP